MSASPAIGHLLDGRYRLDQLIGAGGMARVYEATHTGLGRRVAVKVLRPELGRDRAAIEWFRREAFASGQLDHANIVAVSDCGLLSDGAMFLAMELLQGESLQHRLARERRLAWPVALELMRGVLAGLQYAHDRNIVHCDIKPENLFLSVNKSAIKILDFGIARLYSSLDSSTVSNQTIGTPAYMSPEQATGAAMTPASDLYSASVVLYEMLTGYPPFNERTPRETLMAHLMRRVPAFPPELEIPAELESVVLAGLSKSPDARFSSARAFQAELDAVLAAAGLAVGRTPASASNDFEVLQPLGSSELTDAFIARRSGEAPVVLKRLRSIAHDPRIVDSFLAAVRVAARVSDPRVARVVASGGAGEATFVAVDYLPGEVLDTIVGPELPLQLVVWILHEAAAALHAAHEVADAAGQPLGFVHGRISPASVIIRHSGAVVVGDFEAAASRWLPGNESPEELAGQRVDRRTDVFALGVVLWEALSRRGLFTNADRETKQRQLRAGIPLLPVNAPPELDHIVATALSIDPELRYQTAEAFRVALAGFLRRTGFTAGSEGLAEYLESVFPERVAAGRQWVQASAAVDLPLLAPLPSKIRREALTMLVPRKKTARRVVIGAVSAASIALGIFAFTSSGDKQVAAAPIIETRIAVTPAKIIEIAPKESKRDHAVETLHASANMLWDRGKQDSARLLYADLLKLDPTDAIALERTKVATVQKTKTVAASAETVRRLVMEIDLAIIERRFVLPPKHNALEYLTRLRQIDPANAASRQLGTEVASALAKEAQDNPDEARKLLDAAKQARGDEPKENPNRARSAELLAKARDAASGGRFAEAASAYEGVVAIDPGSHAALGGLAEIAYNQGDFGRAVLSAKRAVGIAPRAVAYRMTLAKSYFKLLRYDDARAQWEAVLGIDPANAAARKHIELVNSKR